MDGKKNCSSIHSQLSPISPLIWCVCRTRRSNSLPVSSNQVFAATVNLVLKPNNWGGGRLFPKNKNCFFLTVCRMEWTFFFHVQNESIPRPDSNQDPSRTPKPWIFQHFLPNIFAVLIPMFPRNNLMTPNLTIYPSLFNLELWLVYRIWCAACLWALFLEPIFLERSSKTKESLFVFIWLFSFLSASTRTIYKTCTLITAEGVHSDYYTYFWRMWNLRTKRKGICWEMREMDECRPAEVLVH